ncbi:hypothetical protein OsccyDRAFT_1404 [Leptolyngbyaceae cyanobacterium JSC-12]|nr:hypothetical protein OsccyDRAFT_1404 [Leptolyngbyaceae cyanobacterium JSC-12]
MFQSNHLPSSAFNLASSYSDPGLKRKRALQVVEKSQMSRSIEALRGFIPAEATPNKRAVMERLIELYAEKALG